MRRLAEVAVEALYRYEILGEGGMADATRSGVAFKRALWAANGSYHGSAHWAATAETQNQREAFAIDRETWDKGPSKDTTGFEYIRASRRIDDRVPGIAEAVSKVRLGIRTKSLEEEGGYTVEVLDKDARVPSWNDLADESIAVGAARAREADRQDEVRRQRAIADRIARERGGRGGGRSPGR